MTGPDRTYSSAMVEGARWSRVRLRPGDIVVSTPPKAGTTWMQNIILHLIFQDLQVRDIPAYSPYVELRPRPFEEIEATIEAQTHRRCLKSHMPADGHRISPDVCYVIVARDPRDVFMSLWNFYCSFEDMFFEQPADPEFDPLPRPPETLAGFWDMWIGKGNFPWETEGYPFGSCFHHLQTWWQLKDRPNILFVHFADLLQDLSGEIARIDGFLGTGCSEEMQAQIAGMVNFKSMKRAAAQIDTAAEETLKGGAQSFINKGTNGRWKGVLSARQLAQYDAILQERLSPNLGFWLENGGPLP
ncbi:sulfotransferase domain-containing protein [Fluviibacterium sp. DFM31]|uniref:Sulfotransferase domain-containing protein n=1 Tax=Meridianimarinicoccus marinus TaxID=3231483 RepID=A0ABV3L6W7_9RHOB